MESRDSYADSIIESAHGSDIGHGTPSMEDVEEVLAHKSGKGLSFYVVMTLLFVIVGLLSWVFYIMSDKVGLIVTTVLMTIGVVFAVMHFARK